MRSSFRLVRAALGLLGAAAIGLTAGCGGAAGAVGGTGYGETIRVWALEDPQNQPIIQGAIDRFNTDAAIPAALSAYPNDWYGLKLRTALGALNSPDVFFNWGGGNLAQFVAAGTVADLSAALADHPEVAEAFLPSVLDVGKVDGVQYGLPMNGIQPVVLFYNKAVFAEAGLEPPRTYDDMLALVDEFTARGVIPFALPGTQAWTELMWLEYLLDRVGGPEKFAAIAAGAPGAWADPAVREALQMCQDLAQRGAFGPHFASTNYDPAGAPRQLATGAAAMFLMGSWEYSSQLANNPDFVTGGDLGWVPFPAVTGGAGDPANVVGNPSNYFAVRAGGPVTAAATDFLMRTLTAPDYLDALIGSGQVPAVQGVEAKLAGTPNAEFATFTYDLVKRAPSFTQSWDQALPTDTSAQLLSGLQRLFLSQIDADEFISAMESLG